MSEERDVPAITNADRFVFLVENYHKYYRGRSVGYAFHHAMCEPGDDALMVLDGIMLAARKEGE